MIDEDFEYRRAGVVEVYVVCEPVVGSREIFVRDNHNRLTWAEIVEYIALKMYPAAEKITIVEDNLSAHKPSALDEIMSAENAARFCGESSLCGHRNTGAWLNIAEIELSLLSRLGVAKRVGTKAELEKQIESYQTKRNAKKIKVNWQFTTTEARVKLKRLYPSIES